VQPLGVLIDIESLSQRKLGYAGFVAEQRLACQEFGDQFLLKLLQASTGLLIEDKDRTRRDRQAHPILKLFLHPLIGDQLILRLVNRLGLDAIAALYGIRLVSRERQAPQRHLDRRSSSAWCRRDG